MKRAILFIFFLSLLAPLTQAQLWKMRRYEITAGFGPSMFFGDIGGYSKSENILGLKDLTFMQTRYDISIGVKYRITQDINARFSFSQGLLNATDVRGSNEKRGYESSISVLEPALLGEYYFIKNRSENSYLFNKGRGGLMNGILGSLDIYAYTGFGLLSYSGTPNDSLKVKQDRMGIKPSGITAVIPVGLGASIAFSPIYSLGIELGGRYAFSDNIDGYTSQYSSSNDVYYFLNLTFTYKLKSTPNGLPSFR